LIAKLNREVAFGFACQFIGLKIKAAALSNSPRPI
jgi:hypothetical protein